MDYKTLYSKTREILAGMNLHIDPRIYHGAGCDSRAVDG